MNTKVRNRSFEQAELRVLRVLDLEEEREELQVAEDQAQWDLAAAAVVTCVGPVQFLLFGALNWDQALPLMGIVLWVALVAFEVSLWWLWSRSCDRIAELQTRPSALLPNEIDGVGRKPTPIRDLLNG